MSEPTPPDRRMLAIVLAFGAAAALVYACLVQTWLYNPRNRQGMEVGFGLLSMFSCEPEHGGSARECRPMSNRELVDQFQAELADIKERAKADPTDPQTQAFAAQAEDELRAPSIFPMLGQITFVCCVLGALSLIACAVLVLAKRRIAWPVMPTTTAILGVGVGLITGCVFVAMKPGPPGYVGVSYGFFAFGAGVVVGIAAALMLNKLLRPHDPDLLEDAMNPEHY